jgi:hypothetical protein
MDPSLLGKPIPAPTAQKPASAFPARLVIIILLVAAVVIGGFMLLAAGSGNDGQLMQRLSARQATTLKLVTDGQKNLSDDNLQKINSELNLILLSDGSLVQAELVKAGLAKKMDKNIAAAESDTTTFDKLASAKLNAQYDGTYHTTLVQKLESLSALLRELHDKSNSKSLKSALSTEYRHLTGYINELEKLASN